MVLSGHEKDGNLFFHSAKIKCRSTRFPRSFAADGLKHAFATRWSISEEVLARRCAPPLNSYGEGLAAGVACAALSLSFATFAVACCNRSASFCRFGFGVGVTLTLTASSEREHALRSSPQASEIVARKSFIVKSQRIRSADCSTANARARNRQPGKDSAPILRIGPRRGPEWN